MTRNSASWWKAAIAPMALVHATEKSLQELGEKVVSERSRSRESALSDLRTAHQG